MLRCLTTDELTSIHKPPLVAKVTQGTHCEAISGPPQHTVRPVSGRKLTFAVKRLKCVFLVASVVECNPAVHDSALVLLSRTSVVPFLLPGGTAVIRAR